MKDYKSISLLHPFTPSAVGLPEEQIPVSHSRPHALAMAMLAREGYQCHMEYFTDKLLPYAIKDMGITWKFHPVSMRWSKDHTKWKKQWSFWALMGYLLRMPDVTIINMSGLSSPFSMYLAKLILRKKKKYIAMLGGQATDLDAARMQYYRRAHHILVHTRQQQQAMQAMSGLESCDIRVFPLGVDCAQYKPAGEKVIFTPAAPKLLYVGRLIELKRIHLAIESLDILIQNGFAGATLRIIGPVASPAYKTYLEEMAMERGIIHAIQYEGFIAHDRLVPFYQEADLFVLPSVHESFGMVMIESMACGTPVAGMDCPGGPKEVIQHGINGILATPDTYASAILEVFQRPEQLHQMKAAARQTAQQSYSMEATYRVLKQSVEDCLL